MVIAAGGEVVSPWRQREGPDRPIMGLQGPDQLSRPAMSQNFTVPSLHPSNQILAVPGDVQRPDRLPVALKQIYGCGHPVFRLVAARPEKEHGSAAKQQSQQPCRDPHAHGFPQVGRSLPGTDHCFGRFEQRPEMLQRAGHLAGRLKAVRGILGEQPINDVVEPFRHFGIAFAERDRLIFRDALQNRQRRLAIEGRLAGREFVEDHAKTEQV